MGRAHGLDGSFYVTRARSRLLSLGAIVTVADTTAAIVRRAGTDRHPIVRLQGIDDRAAVQQLRGRELTIAGEDAPRLGDDEWWGHELEGCRVLDGQREVGVVTRLVELPSCEALEVTPAGERGAVLLIPMVRDAIRGVDVHAGVIDVNMEFIEA